MWDDTFPQKKKGIWFLLSLKFQGQDLSTFAGMDLTFWWSWCSWVVSLERNIKNIRKTWKSRGSRIPRIQSTQFPCQRTPFCTYLNVQMFCTNGHDMVTYAKFLEINWRNLAGCFWKNVERRCYCAAFWINWPWKWPTLTLCSKVAEKFGQTSQETDHIHVIFWFMNSNTDERKEILQPWFPAIISRVWLYTNLV